MSFLQFTTKTSVIGEQPRNTHKLYYWENYATRISSC